MQVPLFRPDMYTIHYLRIVVIAVTSEFDLVVYGYMGKGDVHVVGMLSQSIS